MITALLLTSLAVAPVEATVVAQPQTPVKVWLNKRGSLKQGDRVRVYARTEEDGYLLILHAEPDGRIRVLLPLDPLDDNYIRGGRDVELRGRGDREAFRVYEMEGYGTVYAAFSRDPFQAGAFIRGDHWDYRLFDSWRLDENLDPEAELTALVREMAGGGHFDYDLTHYYVGERVASAETYYGSSSYYYPASYGVSFGLGWYPWGVSVGWGWRSRWYDPWYDPWTGYGYYPSRWYYGSPYSYWGSYYYDPYYYYGAGSYYRYPVHYAGTHYNARGYYTTAFGDHVRGPYTFKSADRGFAGGGITARRRSPTTGSSFASRTSLTQDVAARLTGRRTAPATVDRGVQAPRTGAATTGRRVAPSTTDAARRAVDTRGEATDRRVEPAGWGITDGRRTITPERRTPTPGTAAERRSVTDRTTVSEPATRRPAADVPADRGTAARRSTPSTTTRGVETPTPSRTRTETIAPRRETPTVKQPPTPSRTTVRRSDPPAPTSRTAPTQRSAPRSVPAPSRTPTRSAAPAPSRSSPTRSAAPARQSAPRPSAPRPAARAPSPSSRPAARPSSPPASSRAPARAPTSSSKRRGGG
jgi:hypothetical protein